MTFFIHVYTQYGYLYFNTKLSFHFSVQFSKEKENATKRCSLFFLQLIDMMSKVRLGLFNTKTKNKGSRFSVPIYKTYIFNECLLKRSQR